MTTDDRTITPAEVDKMLHQARLDREQSRYWQDRQERLGALDHVESWLESLRDRIETVDAPRVTVTVKASDPDRTRARVERMMRSGWWVS